MSSTRQPGKRRRLAPTLAALLRKIRDSPIQFDPVAARFELCPTTAADIGNDRPLIKPGLTRILRAVFPVPRTGDEPRALTKSGKVSRRRPFRASGKDPTPAPEVWSARTSLPVPVAPSCKLATTQCRLTQLDDACGTSGFGPNFARRHGVLVDEQLKLYAAGGRAALLYRADDERDAEHRGVMAGGVDPCTGTLLAYFEACGLRVIASQLPLYSAAMNVATSIDVVLTDVATLSELHVFEIKSSTQPGGDDARYTQLRGRLKSSAARGTPLSYYSQHQLQLWVQNQMLHETLGREPDAVAVVRVASGVVRAYKLNRWYRERSAKLVPAIRKRAAGSFRSRRMAKKRWRPQRAANPGSLVRRVGARR